MNEERGAAAARWRSWGRAKPLPAHAGEAGKNAVENRLLSPKNHPRAISARHSLAADFGDNHISLNHSATKVLP